MKILVITPVHHISGVADSLEKIGEVTYLDDPTIEEVCNLIPSFDAIYTNPNKSKVFIGQEVLRNRCSNPPKGLGHTSLEGQTDRHCQTTDEGSWSLGS